MKTPTTTTEMVEQYRQSPEYAERTAFAHTFKIGETVLSYNGRDEEWYEMVVIGSEGPYLTICWPTARWDQAVVPAESVKRIAR